MAEYRHRRAGFLTALQGWLRDVWLHARGLGAERARFPDLTDSAATVAGSDHGARSRGQSSIGGTNPANAAHQRQRIIGAGDGPVEIEVVRRAPTR